MIILSLDTGGPCTNLSLAVDGWIVSKQSDQRYGHANIALQLIDELLAQVHGEQDKVKSIDGNAIDTLIYCAGPGSYTGLRLGAGILQGISLVNQTPIINVSRLKAIAYGLGRTDVDIIVLEKAYADKVFIGHYQWAETGCRAVVPDRMILKDDIDRYLPEDQCVFTGSEAESLCSESNKTNYHVRAYDMTQTSAYAVSLVQEEIARNGPPKPDTQARPCYLTEAADWHQK